MNYILIIMFSLLSSLFSNQQKADFESMNVNDFETLLQQKSTQLIDVRTPEEYIDGHIAKSKNINVLDASFADQADKNLSKEKPVAVYCRSGQRSKKAATILAKKGYKIYELNTGINGWIQANKPIEK